MAATVDHRALRRAIWLGNRTAAIGLQIADRLQTIRNPQSRGNHTNFSKENRPRFFSKGAQRSPSLATRAGIFRIVKSSIRTPRSTSRHVTGVETVAFGLGRTE